MKSPRVCEPCRARSRLVEALGVRLDVRHCDTERVAALLQLADHELLAALGIKDGVPSKREAPREGSLGGSNAQVANGAMQETARGLAICRHDSLYPQGADAPERWAPPAVLHVAGDSGHLARLAAEPAVALVGTRRATAYGLDVAQSLAAELASAGVPVISGLAEGIAAAALAGALNAAGTALSVMAGGVDVCSPADRRALYDAVVARACLVSERPAGARPRRWSYAARNRIIAGLASVVVVVEAEDRPGDLMLPRFAQAIGRKVAAVPGRVTSPASRGSHDLLNSGAHLVESAQDVLDLLYGVGVGGTSQRRSTAAQVSTRRPSSGTPPAGGPEGRLHAGVMSLVARGADTLEGLLERGVDYSQAAVALMELELEGRIVRADGGRYLVAAMGPGSRGPGQGEGPGL